MGSRDDRIPDSRGYHAIWIYFLSYEYGHLFRDAATKKAALVRAPFVQLARMNVRVWSVVRVPRKRELEENAVKSPKSLLKPRHEIQRLYAYALFLPSH